jgi:hypothetical protein
VIEGCLSLSTSPIVTVNARLLAASLFVQYSIQELHEPLRVVPAGQAEDDFDGDGPLRPVITFALVWLLATRRASFWLAL